MGTRRCEQRRARDGEPRGGRVLVGLEERLPPSSGLSPVCRKPLGGADESGGCRFGGTTGSSSVGWKSFPVWR